MNKINNTDRLNVVVVKLFFFNQLTNSTHVFINAIFLVFRLLIFFIFSLVSIVFLYDNEEFCITLYQLKHAQMYYSNNNNNDDDFNNLLVSLGWKCNHQYRQ